MAWCAGVGAVRRESPPQPYPVHQSTMPVVATAADSQAAKSCARITTPGTKVVSTFPLHPDRPGEVRKPAPAPRLAMKTPTGCA